jgi:hypothetical protein
MHIAHMGRHAHKLKPRNITIKAFLEQLKS